MNKQLRLGITEEGISDRGFIRTLFTKHVLYLKKLWRMIKKKTLT